MRDAQYNWRGLPTFKPQRLKVGDTIGLISPASNVLASPGCVQVIEKQLATMGLLVKSGIHVLDHYGYLAGRDEDRAADVNAMFADSSIKGIFALRGGWGCNRILPLLDYTLIRKHPKVVMGYSDITSLLIALYVKSGIVTFHGPLGVSSWGPFTTKYVQSILFEGGAVALQNPDEVDDNLKSFISAKQVITPGRARGRLMGGNLSVLSSMIGSAYLPDWRGKILFLEDIGEEVYRIDRMLTQLKMAGVLDQIAGFIFGQCTNCTTEGSLSAFTLMDILFDHIRPLGIPAWSGSIIGHIPEQFTLPLGIEVEVDANEGSILMLEQAVL